MEIFKNIITGVMIEIPKVYRWNEYAGLFRNAKSDPFTMHMLNTSIDVSIHVVV